MHVSWKHPEGFVSQFYTCFASFPVKFTGDQFHRRPQACLGSDDTALSLRWTWFTGKTEEHLHYIGCCSFLTRVFLTKPLTWEKEWLTWRKSCQRWVCILRGFWLLVPPGSSLCGSCSESAGSRPMKSKGWTSCLTFKVENLLIASKLWKM